MSRIRELGESIGSAVLDGIGRASARVQERKPLAYDLLESDESYLAVFDAPGVDAHDVEVRFERGTLYVRIDRFREFYDDFEMRLPGRGMALDGEIELPEGADVDPSGATATVTASGTLQVEIPKVEPDEGTAGTAEKGPVEVETDVTPEPEEGEAEDEGDRGDDGDEDGS